LTSLTAANYKNITTLWSCVLCVYVGVSSSQSVSGANHTVHQNKSREYFETDIKEKK